MGRMGYDSDASLTADPFNEPPQPPHRSHRPAILSLAASAISGFAYTATTTPEQNCEPTCEDWHTYGWPAERRSSWLGWLISDMEDSHSLWNYGSDGVSEGLFLSNSALWFAGLAPLALGASLIASRFLRPSPAL